MLHFCVGRTHCNDAHGQRRCVLKIKSCKGSASWCLHLPSRCPLQAVLLGFQEVDALRYASQPLPCLCVSCCHHVLLRAADVLGHVGVHGLHALDAGRRGVQRALQPLPTLASTCFSCRKAKQTACSSHVRTKV